MANEKTIYGLEVEFKPIGDATKQKDRLWRIFIVIGLAGGGYLPYNTIAFVTKRQAELVMKATGRKLHQFDLDCEALYLLQKNQFSRETEIARLKKKTKQDYSKCLKL